MPTTMIGLRIRERRRAAGLRQVELAERMGISASYLNLIEREKRRASPDLAARAARALGVDPSELDGAVERRLADRMAASQLPRDSHPCRSCRSPWLQEPG